MLRGFDAGAIEKRYAFIDACPAQFVSAIVTLPVGTLEERTRGIVVWRDALLEGCLPPAGTWPAAPIGLPARSAIEALGLHRYCKGQPELVDMLLVEMLRSFRRSAGSLLDDVEEILDTLIARERAEQQSAREAYHNGSRDGALQHEHNELVQLDEETLSRLRRQAEAVIAAKTPPSDAEILAMWQPHVAVWDQLAEVFDDLSVVLGLGWDMSRGLLAYVGWRELLRLRALVEQLPQLAEIVRALGRLQTSCKEPSVSEILFEPMRRVVIEQQERRTPLVPAETRSVQRGAEISRMLPSEAVTFGHPKLRYVWHARRAERALLTYRVEGTESVPVEVESAPLEAIEKSQPRPERGPIIAIVDTSGSMQGVPEQVAKALVLEALRLAYTEQRRCLLYSFSGPGQVIEHELSLGVDGLGLLLQFLGMSFGGGTDAYGVTLHVLERLEQDSWKSADVMLVSDGEWPMSGDMFERVQAVASMGTRFHGVLIGANRSSFEKICDPVHVFQDWAAVLRHLRQLPRRGDAWRKTSPAPSLLAVHLISALDADLLLQRSELVVDLSATARPAASLQRGELGFKLVGAHSACVFACERLFDLATCGDLGFFAIELVFDAAELVEGCPAAALGAERLCPAACLRLLHLGGDDAFAGVDLLVLLLHALQIGLVAGRRGAGLGEQGLGSVAIGDDGLLLDERLAGERLVVGLEGELGALAPLLGLGVERSDLALKLLLGGDAGGDFLLGEHDLLAHLGDHQLDALAWVLCLVEQRVDVARDDLAHPVEDAHARH